MPRAFESEIANMSGATSEQSILFAGLFAVLESPNSVAKHRPQML
jgi:hypothetical protein